MRYGIALALILATCITADACGGRLRIRQRPLVQRPVAQRPILQVAATKVTCVGNTCYKK